jgi:hypothetical protein
MIPSVFAILLDHAARARAAAGAGGGAAGGWITPRPLSRTRERVARFSAPGEGPCGRFPVRPFQPGEAAAGEGGGREKENTVGIAAAGSPGGPRCSGSAAPTVIDTASCATGKALSGLVSFPRRSVEARAWPLQPSPRGSSLARRSGPNPAPDPTLLLRALRAPAPDLYRATPCDRVPLRAANDAADGPRFGQAASPSAVPLAHVGRGATSDRTVASNPTRQNRNPSRFQYASVTTKTTATRDATE